MPGKDKDRRERYPWIFVSFYAISYMAYAISNTFFPIYYKQLGYSGSSLGLLLSVGPFVALLSQPFWGIMADRASSKNLILQIICAVSTVSIFLLVADSRFYFLSLSFAMFSFFYYPLFALGDTITLEYLKNTSWNFGPIRLAGTFGFAVMAIIAGKLASMNITNIFFLFQPVRPFHSCLRANSRLSGSPAWETEISILALLKNRNSCSYRYFSWRVMSSMGFYYSFTRCMRQLGAGRTLVGVSMFCFRCQRNAVFLFIANIEEIPRNIYYWVRLP